MMNPYSENPDGCITAQKAQNALCFHYDICYDAQGQPKNNGVVRKPKPTYEELISQLNTSSAYPNPTDQFVTIAYTFLHAKEQSTLSIFDNLGRQIEVHNLGEVYEGQQFIDTRQLSNGVYLFQILQENKKVSEGKFAVTH